MSKCSEPLQSLINLKVQVNVLFLSDKIFLNDSIQSLKHASHSIAIKFYSLDNQVIMKSLDK